MKRYTIDPVTISHEAGSILTRPFPLSGFPGIPFEYVEILKARGIKHTGDLFEKVQSERQQDELSVSMGIPLYRLNELFTLCELSRIPGVDGIFARVLCEAGIRSTADLAGAECRELLKHCRSVIEKHGYAIRPPVEKDITRWINFAKVVLKCDQKPGSK